MKKKILRKGQKGITLIALVVTIIVLLILAGVSINLIMGNQGILGQATSSVDKHNEAQAREKLELVLGELGVDKYTKEEVYNEDEYITDRLEKEGMDVDGDNVTVDGWEFTIDRTVPKIVLSIGQVPGGDNEELPENTPETDAGKEVALEDGWGTETMRYVSTDDGKEVTSVEKVATVYAVSDGQGNSVPVPYGFYYVGGDLSSGVVISDNSNDKDKYLGETTVGTELQGNQFVWIPCTENEYKKTDWGSSYQNANWDTTTSASELTQIQKYGGFYVARYEAGLAETITETTEKQKHDGQNQVYNEAGVPQSKAGLVPWNFVDWNNSKANAESMYNTACVGSGLITGTQWDVMLKTIVAKTDLEESDLTNSESWGNYKDTQIAYEGRLAKLENMSGSWWFNPFEEKSTGNTTYYGSDNTYGDLLTTGASNVTQKYNIFDVAGNVWEWTEETSYYGENSATQYRVVRGGACINAFETYPACYRLGNCTVSSTHIDTGFRPVLYMK